VTAAGRLLNAAAGRLLNAVTAAGRLLSAATAGIAVTAGAAAGRLTGSGAAVDRLVAVLVGVCPIIPSRLFRGLGARSVAVAGAIAEGNRCRIG
jgi:hypothetical protein